ncbi:MAG: hypothetical protein ACOH17_09925 [Cellulomonas sp.]
MRTVIHCDPNHDTKLSAMPATMPRVPTVPWGKNMSTPRAMTSTSEPQ